MVERSPTSIVSRLFRRKKGGEPTAWRTEISEAGLTVSAWYDHMAPKMPMVPGYLEQLVDAELAVPTNEGVTIAWDDWYEALEDPGLRGFSEELRLPSLTSLRPQLRTVGSPTDSDFSVAIGAWVRPDGTATQGSRTGAVLQADGGSSLLTADQWRLVKEVVSFARRPPEQHADAFHLESLGRIRRLAQRAGADVDDFLARYVVLTPETLQLRLQQRSLDGKRIIEVEPSFEDAPPGWIDAFDRRDEVRQKYQITTAQGMTVVVVSDEVRSVLKEIKRLPGRRASGAAGERLITNPYAVLGPAAHNVIVEEEFEAARDAAGISYERFSPLILRTTTGGISRLGIRVESSDSNGNSDSAEEWIDAEPLRKFIEQARAAIAQSRTLLAWKGYDLELTGESARHIDQLEAALDELARPKSVIEYQEVHDLSRYMQRITGIGYEEPSIVPQLLRKDKDSDWFPDNVMPAIKIVSNDGESDITIPVTPESLPDIQHRIGTARQNGSDAVELPGVPGQIPLVEAEQAVDAVAKALGEVSDGTFNPPPEPEPTGDGEDQTATLPTPRRKTLVLAENFEAVEYAERRLEALRAFPSTPRTPASLSPKFSLKEHQSQGLAWLQHLFAISSEYQVRGALLADDMGLGKTLQLLCLMASVLESRPTSDPMLVVAPVSLLENWRQEAEKFFNPGAFRIKVAYGDALAGLRVRSRDIDERLISEDGLKRFLERDWLGDAQLVLTTYETLRDLEFSFARERWSIMVCDEAQKIKNPAAQVSRAAKKQNAQFKIACTGTPVENSLIDLWSLFDFIQPGLLGALTQFSRSYQRPIEAETEEQKDALEELRKLIDPQVLRRTKKEVAKDLPAKFVVDECRQLSMSVQQRNLYAAAINNFKSEKSQFQHHFSLLHYLRSVCTDPTEPGLTARLDDLREYRKKAPKMDWLLNQLVAIKGAGEKAIIFCEFKDIQRVLQAAIKEAFGIQCMIINGSTSTRPGAANSRQNQIKRFQDSEGFGVIILSPVAVGFGVNIQAANHVIHYTRTWNPAKEDQATDRAYRIGQTKDVYVYYPVVAAEDFVTFDVKLDRLLEMKRALADDMLNGTGELRPSDFDTHDMAPDGHGADLDPVIDMGRVDALSGRQFEGLIGALWRKEHQQQIYCTPAAGDYGVDVVGLARSHGHLIQTKHSADVNRRLGWDAIRDVVGGQEHYAKLHGRVQFQKVAVTNVSFNTNAVAQATVNEVLLLQRKDLEKLLARHSVRMSEVYEALGR